MTGPAVGSKFTGNQMTNPRSTQGRGIADVTTGVQHEDLNAHGGVYGYFDIDETITMASVATIDTTATIPVGTYAIALTTYVKTTLSGASVANYIVGIAGATNRFITTNTAITAGDSAQSGLKTDVYSTATAIRVTPDTSATAGVLRICARCWYAAPANS